MAELLFKRPDGKIVSIDSSEAASALSDGYEPVTKEQVRASRQPGQAAIEGVVRGASAGFLEPVVADVEARYQGKSRAQVREEMKLRRAENPLASGAAELGGVVGTTLATGGGASALAGGGLRGAAVETGLYGMGSMVTESTLENQDLTAERLAAGAVGGALAGGAAHLGFSALGKGASAVMSKFGGKGFRGALQDAASTIEERALAEGNKTLVKKLVKRGGDLRQVVDYARDNGLPVSFTGETLDAVKGRLSATGDETADFVRRLDGVTPLTNDLNRTRVVDEVKKQLGVAFKGDIIGEREAERFINAEIEPLLSKTDLDWPSLYKLQSRLRDSVERGANGAAVLPVKGEVYDTGRKTLRNLIFAETEKLGAGSETQLHRLQRDYAKGSFLKDAIESRIASIRSTGGVPGLGLMDAVRGGGLGASAGTAIAGPIGAPIGAVIGAYANKKVRESGGSMVASALRGLAESKITGGISKNLAAHIGGIMSMAPEALGAYRFPLAEAAAHGADALLERHVDLASSPMGHHYLSTLGLPVESESEVEAAGARLAVLDALERKSTEDDADQSNSVELLFGGGAGRKPSLKAGLNAKEFAAVRASLDGILTQPESVFSQVPAEVSSAAPSTSAAMAAKVAQVAQYLDSVAPKDPNVGMPVAIKPPWAPSQSDLDKFSQAVEAVENPARVLKNMSQGYVSSVQLDAIRAVYPALYQNLQQKISERLATWEKPLAYSQKLALVPFLGPQALGMSQQQAQILQELQTQAAGSQPGNGGTKRPDGRQDVDQEENLKTQGQRMEGRAK
jgi:hypothetical protein